MTTTSPGRSGGPGSASLLSRILEAVASHEAVEPLDLDPPLGSRIDVDALETLFADGRGGPTVEFSYLGYDVTVSADRNVTVDRRDTR